MMDQDLQEAGILAIIRGVRPSSIVSVVQILLEEGIQWVEVSLSEEESGLNCVRVLRQEFGGSIRLGAGTVLRPSQVDRSLDEGAEYIVTPGWDKELVQYAGEREVVVIPGVLSPSETTQAVNEGAEVLKLFPAGVLGPGYVKGLLGPFPNVHFVAVGGVSRDNLTSFLRAGCRSVAIGTDLVPRGAGEEHLAGIRERAKEYKRLLDEVR